MKRLLCTAALALATALATLPAGAADLTDLSADERAAFRAEVRAYLLDNPEIIIEAVNLLETRQAEEQAAADDQLVQVNAQDIFEDGYSWVGGNPEGDLVMVEFLDYRCGYCRRAHDEVQELLQTDGNIRFIVKEFPILGPDSLASSRFAISVLQLAGDAAYEQVHEALMTLNGDVTEPALRRLAGTFDLDADAILAHMESDAVTQVIADTRALAQRLQITGTPTFVLGDQLLRGYMPLDAMRELAAEARG